MGCRFRRGRARQQLLRRCSLRPRCSVRSPGTPLDVTVSSIGDAKSLEGGMLLLTPLRAAGWGSLRGVAGPLTVAV